MFGERHLRHMLLSYMNYHNEVRTHLSLEKDAPASRAVERTGVCTENLIRVDDVMESPNLAE